jgi:hypothetical protein
VILQAETCESYAVVGADFDRFLVGSRLACTEEAVERACTDPVEIAALRPDWSHVIAGYNPTPREYMAIIVESTVNDWLRIYAEGPHHAGHALEHLAIYNALLLASEMPDPTKVDELSAIALGGFDEADIENPDIIAVQLALMALAGAEPLITARIKGLVGPTTDPAQDPTTTRLHLARVIASSYALTLGIGRSFGPNIQFIHLDSEGTDQS